LKPANVLFCSDFDDRPGIKVSDFGIARRSMAEPGAGVLGGTPDYMSPEQQQGRVWDFGPWTDLFALGRLAIALLRHDVLDGSHADAVPRGFSDWIARMLHPRPMHRFPTAADAVASLDKLPVGSHSDIAEPDWPEPTSRQWPSITASAVFTADAPGDDSAGEISDGQAPEVFLPPPFPPCWQGASFHSSQPSLPSHSLSMFGLRAIPMMGRRVEHDFLWEELGKVVSGGARTVVLRGPAGSGKTRLAMWLAERAQELGVAFAMKANHDAVLGPQDGLEAMVLRFWGGTHVPCPRRTTGFLERLAQR